MARGGGQIQYGYHPSAGHVPVQIPPWLALLQAGTAGFGAYQQQQQINQANELNKAQLDQTRNEEMRKQAEERQAFARLSGQLADPQLGQLDPGTQSQVNSVMGGIGDARQRVDMAGKFAEARVAIGAVEQRRKTNRALQEVDRMLSEIGGVSQPDASRTPVSSGNRVLEDPQLDRVRSGLQSLRAQIEANPEQADNFMDLAVKLQVDPSGRIMLAAAEEEMRTAKSRRETDEKLTPILKQLNPEVFGSVEGPIFGAAQYVQDENNYLRQRQLDSARAADAANLESQRHKNALKEQSAASFNAAYTSAFQMFYSQQAGSQEQPGAPDALTRAQNQAEAYLTRRGFGGEVGQLEAGRKAQLVRFAAASMEATKYAQELMQSHVANQQEPIAIGAHRFRTDTTAGTIGNILTPQQRTEIQAPRQLTPADQREYMAAIRVRLRHQLGIDEETANLAIENAMIEDQFKIFNQDLGTYRRGIPGSQVREREAIAGAFAAGLPGVGITGEVMEPQVTAPLERLLPLPPQKREDIIRRLVSDRNLSTQRLRPPSDFLRQSNPTIVR